MGAIKDFSDLQASMAAASQAPPRAPPPPRESQNPRIRANMTVRQWSENRKSRRRAEWQQRATPESTTPVRDKAAFVSFEENMNARLRAESCLDRSVPLLIESTTQRPESGMSGLAYFSRKWQRCGGALGQHESLNPYLDILRRGEQPR